MNINTNTHLPHLWKQQLLADWYLHPVAVCLDPAERGRQKYWSATRIRVFYVKGFVQDEQALRFFLCVRVSPCWWWRCCRGCPAICCWLGRTCSLGLSVSACTPDSSSLPHNTLEKKAGSGRWLKRLEVLQVCTTLYILFGATAKVKVCICDIKITRLNWFT